MDATESEGVGEACSVRVVYTTTPHRYGDMGCKAGAVSCIECWPVVSQVSQRRVYQSRATVACHLEMQKQASWMGQMEQDPAVSKVRDARRRGQSTRSQGCPIGLSPLQLTLTGDVSKGSGPWFVLGSRQNYLALCLLHHHARAKRLW